VRPDIRKAVVLGAGTMGSAIAAHLANAGVPVVLLDIVPGELTEEEQRRGLTLQSPEVRNRLATQAIARLQKAQPPAFFSPERAGLITVGNLEDHLDAVSDADWVVEAVIEVLPVKQQLMERVERFWRPGTMVSTNTSGLPVHRIVEDRSLEFRRHFLGTHFFNPPRYMRLLEIIPTSDTDPEIVARMSRVGEFLLGKGIVYAKDRPNFIANRIGTYSFLLAVKLMLEQGLTIEEVDELTGPAIGRPRTGTFRLLDLVGLDIALHVAENAYRNLPEDEEREIYRIPEFLRLMAERGWLGEKTGGGFYRRVDGEIYTLDYTTMEYRPRRRASFPSVEAARNIEDAGKRIRQLIFAEDRAGRYLWPLLSGVLVYTARRIPEITDEIVNIDRAMRWGFGWDLGPFELWDALGVRDVAQRLEREGRELPPLVQAVLRTKEGTFYRKMEGIREYFDLGVQGYRPEVRSPQVIVLSSLREEGKVVASNPGASLIDLGDGVACLEFHTKMNTIGEDIIRMLHQSLEEVRKHFDGLVIGNQGRDFSVGANLMLLLLEAQEGNWEDLDLAVRQFQRAGMAIKYFDRPVVAAPFGRTLAGGCEICLAAPRIQAAAETYMGLVEVGVGLIPAGGGTKEMVLRSQERVPEGATVDLLPLLRGAFETIAMAKVSTSAEDARRLGFLRPTDGISMNPDHLLYDAKQAVLEMVRSGYRPPLPRKIRVVGERGRAAILSYLYNMRVGEYITPYEEHIGRKLAYVMTGGDVPENALVTEDYLLDLEREAFLSLLGEPKTQERIRHMLQTGKPLRN